MQNKELFTLDPEQINLKNEGVAKVRAINEPEDYAIAEYELRTFVCEGEYREGLRKMLEAYLDNFDKKDSDQPAFWVSGFYGSGKSHLVKMASYLWDDFQFPDGTTARNIKPLPADIHDALVELDRKQKIHGKLTIAGTLRDFPSKDIRYSFLQLLLHSLGYPTQYHHFKFIYWLKKEGIYDQVKAVLESSGKNFIHEVENLFVSSHLARAVLEVVPGQAENAMKLREQFRAQFPRLETIGREDFVKTIREEILPLSFDNKIPCTIIVLDEVQQFIGQDPQLAFDVQLLAEDLCSRFDGKFILVGTGQNALRDTPNLQRLMARFVIPIQLTNTDIQTVIRKTILEKKPSAVPVLKKKMEDALGEISRILEGTKYSFITEDKELLVADYPVLPSTRKLWNKTLQVIDVAGTSSQLRNQLRIIDESLKSIANKEVGEIVPADFIFGQNQTQLIQAGLLMNDTNTLIQQKLSAGGDSALEGRILSAVFLLDQVTSNDPETGLKINENTIADVLIDNLNKNSGIFRDKIKTLVKKLVDEKVLMPIDDEYKLQTKIGAEWEKEFTKQVVKLSQSGDDQVPSLRKEKIIHYFKEKAKGLYIAQGISKIVRDFEVWDKDTPPDTSYKLNLWVRDGWYENEANVLNEIREQGTKTPLAYIFVKKFRDPELKTEIVKYLAAGKTLEVKGTPTTPEGVQAKKSLETRRMLANDAIGDLIDKICKDAVVYLAGGNMVCSGSLKENIREALHNIADRQFSEFGRADAPNWGKALSKALTGNPDALEVTGYKGEVNAHPVAVELLRFLGGTKKKGKEIRDHFMSAPYGWSQDAIDTILILLTNTGWISSDEPELKPARINQTLFKKEVHTLTARDKITIRKLLQEAGINVPPNKELFPYSNELLNKLKELASKVSGDAPLPEPIHTGFIKEIEDKEGNERLLEIVQQKEDLKIKYVEWSKKAGVLDKRFPSWELLESLTRFAPDEGVFEDIQKEIDAIRDNRLFFSEPDPVQPLLNRFSEHLLKRLNEKKGQYNRIYDDKMQALQTNEHFSKLTPEQKHNILAKHQLLYKPEIKPADPRGLLLQFRKVSLEAWDTKITALPAQFQEALEEAIKLTEPKTVTYSLPRKTISRQEEIAAYVEKIKRDLEELLKNAKSIILK